MRIVQVSQYYRANDAASIIVDSMVSELRRRGHDVIIATPDPYCTVENSICLAYRLWGKQGLINSALTRFFVCTFSYIALFPRMIREVMNADCIMSHHHNYHFSTLSAFLLSRLFNKPYYVFIHDVLTYYETSSFLSKFFDRMFFGFNVGLLKRASGLFVQSESIKKQFCFKDAVVLPNSIHSERYSGEFSDAVATLRAHFGFEGKRILLFLGTAYRDRGLDLLVKALNIVSIKHPNVVALFVGRAPEREHLLAIAKELGVEDKLCFTGVVSHNETPVYIQMCDVAIGPLAPPPTSCTLPVKVLEYMASGKPTIALEGSVPPELLIKRKTGLVLSKIDETELAGLIIWLLDNSADAERIGESARQHVLLNYDAKVIVDRLLSSLIHN